jgi:hypothetical protein
MPNLWSAEKYGHYFTAVVCKNNHASYSYFVEIIFAESQFLMSSVSEYKRHVRSDSGSVSKCPHNFLVRL